jgi:hypothetical protein
MDVTRKEEETKTEIRWMTEIHDAVAERGVREYWMDREE